MLEVSELLALLEAELEKSMEDRREGGRSGEAAGWAIYFLASCIPRLNALFLKLDTLSLEALFVVVHRVCRCALEESLPPAPRGGSARRVQPP